MVFSGDLLKKTNLSLNIHVNLTKSTWKYLDKYQVLCLQVQVSTKYFWISKCQVQVSTKYSRFCIKYQVPSTSTLLDPNPGGDSGEVNYDRKWVDVFHVTSLSNVIIVVEFKIYSS